MSKWQAAALVLLLSGSAVSSGCGTPTREKPVFQDIASPTSAGAETEPVEEPGSGAGSASPEQDPRGASPAVVLTLPRDLPQGSEGEAVRRGWQIFRETPAALAAAARRRGEEYSGNALSCRHCHLDDGTRAGAFPLAEATRVRYHPREGLVLGPAERVNACLRRALNAPPLPGEAPELADLTAYLAWLGEKMPASPATGLDPGQAPDRTANQAAGAEIYRSRCASCHGDADNTGEEATRSGPAPPLWGPSSYTAGSGMHHLLVAAAFIHANMPPESLPEDPALTLEEAYDTAAFVNTLARPSPSGLELDYPALTEKPADCPYPPYPDSLSAQQHKYGPFRPIVAAWNQYRLADRWVYWTGPVRSEAPPLLGILHRQDEGDTTPP